MPRDTTYDELLEQGRGIYAGTRIGRPGRGRGYWWLFVPFQLMRVAYRIRCHGRERIGSGPAILVGNHITLLDPVLVGVTNRFRLTFFTKVEAYESSIGFFFRWIGQIPLRRGDEEATRWALAIAADAVARGNKLSIYPEGTRSPDRRTMHRLHRRVLVPILQANPGVPVHAMAIDYGGRGWWRQRISIRFSPPLELDPATMTADDLTSRVTEALVETGGMPYEHTFARIN